MHNFDVNLQNPRAPEPLRPGDHPDFGQGASAAAREIELQRLDGMKIAQSAVQGIGMSTKEIRGTWLNSPNHALAVSLLFTRATNQRIMLGTEPGHVLSTSHLCNSLLHDSRFMQVPMSHAAPGDIVVQSGLNPDGYAGIVVDHGRIVGDNSHGVQNNSSLVETQRHLPPTLLFRYIGVQKYPGYTFAALANEGFNPDEPRLPAGQPGGGQWTSGGATLAPSMPLVSGVNPEVGPGAKGVAAPETPKNYYVNKTLRVLQVKKPDGSVAIVKTKVKTQEQADLLGVPVGTKVPVFVPPGKDPQAMVDDWRKKTKDPLDFAATWRPGGANDYKKKDPTTAIYDAYGNFEYGATGAANGFTKGQVVAGGDAVALVRHGAHNNPINRADIEAGHDAVSQGGKLQTAPYKWSPQAGAN